MRSTDLRIIAEGEFETVAEARHALLDPFIEEFVEQHGKFRPHDFDNIRVAGGLALSDLTIEKVDEGIFEISCKDSPQTLNHHRASRLAEFLRRQAMFDDVRVESFGE